MSGTINKVILVGRLGDSVKLTYFSEGNCIGRFPLATDETYTNKTTNEKITNTEWHTIVVRNKVAELFEKYVNKGDMVYLEGRLKTRQWQGEDSVVRYATEIHVTDFRFLSRNQSNANPQVTENKSVNMSSESAPSVVTHQANDDLPF